MAICSYNNARIIPAPIFTFNKEYQTSQDGTKIGTLFTYSINGYLLSFNGSPDASGNFYTGSLYNPDGRAEPTYLESLNEYNSVASIFRKQEALRELFSEDGHSLEFQAFDGSPAIKCNPRIKSINFNEGVWFNKCEYSIQLESDVVYINGQIYGEDDYTDKISEASESWSIETVEDSDADYQQTYRLTHTISATGKRFYDKDESLEKEAWEQAKSFCLSRAGYDSTVVVGSDLDISTLSRFNYVKGENLDKLGGTYTLTESWILSNDGANEVFTVSTEKNGSVTNVVVNGTITGLSTDDSIGNKLQSAENKWSIVQSQLYTRANLYSSKTLNTNPESYSVSRNSTTGVITYNYSYTDKNNIFANAINESISITQSFGVDSFAEIFVLGRTKGPVLQPLDTFQSKKKTLSVSATFPVDSIISYENPFLTSSELSSLVDAVQPTGQVFISDNNFSWNALTGEAEFSRSWTYED